jgi:hypothetical protein
LQMQCYCLQVQEGEPPKAPLAWETKREIR